MKPNGLSARIYRALAKGPKNNRQLQDELCEDGATIATYAAQLTRYGYIKRIDGQKGRGKPATYAQTREEPEA